MSYGRVLLEPSTYRKRDYKGESSDPPVYVLRCVACGTGASVEYNAIIRDFWRDEAVLGSETVASARRYFGIGIVGKSHDGGWPVMHRVSCPGCATSYLICAGVADVHQSLFHVTIQGIVELLPETR